MKNFGRITREIFSLSYCFLPNTTLVIDKLLKLPKGSPNYLCPLIQTELKSVLVGEVLCDIKSKLQSVLLFAIILDTTQEVSKKDQLSKVYRFVKIDCHDDGTPSELKVVEAFTSFTKVDNLSAMDCTN